MTFADLTLIGKRLLVSVIAAVVPLAILIACLWLTRALLDHPVRRADAAPGASWRRS